MFEEKKFFIGAGGQQSGPFSESEIKDKIATKEVRPDTLVWFEGLAEWQRSDTISVFQDAFAAKPGAEAGAAPSDGGFPPETRVEPMRPVFSTTEAVFFRPKGPRPQMVALGISVFLLGIGLIWYMSSDDDSDLLSRVASVRKQDTKTRAGRLQKADSDFLLNPNFVPAEFEMLLREDSKDEIGKKAFSTLENAYIKRHHIRDLANLYVTVGRPWDAVPYFMEEKAFAEAEQAAASASEKAPDLETKKKMLIASISLLTGPLHNVPAALPRIQLLEKQFPNENHPFGYYLLSRERKIADLFERTSMFFVEGLVNHVKAEFPQLKLASRPIVAVGKEGKDLYRVVGSYKGDVSLSYDRLKNIRFEYWLVGTEWQLVATNVTGERREWAKFNKNRFRDSQLTGDAMLGFLETLMRNQFPQLGLHQRIGQQDMLNAADRKPAEK